MVRTNSGTKRRTPRIFAILAPLFLTLLMAPPLPGQSAVPLQSPPVQPPLTRATPSSGAESALTPEELGDLHMARQRYQAAIEAYHRVPHLSPLVWNKLGMANQQMFILAEAKKCYETALKMDPANPDVLNNLGTVYFSMKQFSNAERYYRKALKLNPKSALIYKNLGTDLLAEDKFQKGWDCYQSALAIDPDIFERSYQYRIGEPTPVQKRGAMNYFLAKSYVRVGMYDRAVEYLRMAIDEGFTDRKKVLADKEFATLHGSSAFEQLLAEQRRSQ